MSILYILTHFLTSTIWIFFILGHVLGGHVTVTGGDCRLYYNYRHVITQQLYQLWKVRSARGLSPQIVLHPACVHIMKRPVL